MTRYMILWWIDGNLYGALFDDEVQAESAARVRNAVYLELPDGEEKPKVLDYWKRDDKGTAIPIRWRDLIGRPGAPYMGTGISI